MNKVVFLCKGSRGDVLPLLSLAIAYKNEHPTDNVTLVCTAIAISGLEDKISKEGIEIVSTLPEVTVASDDEKLEVLKQEAEVCCKACVCARLIVFNLFSLEGYFISQELNIPCIAASPFLISRTPPTGFKERLAQALPGLYEALIADAGKGTVSYAEVDHWMWRLFLDDWGFVCDHMNFSSRTPLSVKPLPPPTPLLYGLSPLLTPRQSYWPSSVHICGYWLSPACLCPPPSPKLTAIVQCATSTPLVYIGFGSMESYMKEDIDWESLLVILNTALKDVKMKGFLQCNKEGPISSAYCQMSCKPECLFLWSEYVSHEWLFEKCVAVLHHGGSGTVATALLSKKPQLICPVLFDQHNWAETVAWKNLGVQLPPAKHLTVRVLSKCLELVCSSREIADSIECMYANIVNENGVKNALIEIDKILYK